MTRTHSCEYIQALEAKIANQKKELTSLQELYYNYVSTNHALWAENKELRRELASYACHPSSQLRLAEKGLLNDGSHS